MLQGKRACLGAQSHPVVGWEESAVRLVTLLHPEATPAATLGLVSPGSPQVTVIFSDHSGGWNGFLCVALSEGPFHWPPPSTLHGRVQPAPPAGLRFKEACLNSEPQGLDQWGPTHPSPLSTWTHPLASGSWLWQPFGHPREFEPWQRPHMTGWRERAWEVRRAETEKACRES